MQCNFAVLLQEMWWTVHLEGGPRRVNHAAVAMGERVFSFGTLGVPNHKFLFLFANFYDFTFQVATAQETITETRGQLMSLFWILQITAGPRCVLWKYPCPTLLSKQYIICSSLHWLLLNVQKIQSPLIISLLQVPKPEDEVERAEWPYQRWLFQSDLKVELGFNVLVLK